MVTVRWHCLKYQKITINLMVQYGNQIKRPHHKDFKKVTIWIANILEEASYKQLLEELEELEEKEGPVLDILDELLESVMVTRKEIDSYGFILSADNSSISTSFSTKKIEDGNESDSDYGMSLDKNEIRTENDEKSHDEEILAYHDKSTIKEQLQTLLEEKINDIFADIDNIIKQNYNIITGEKNDLYGDSNTGNNFIDLNQTTDNNYYIPSHISNDYVDRDGIVMPGKTNNNNNLPLNIAQDYIDPDDTTVLGQMNNENNLASNFAQDYIGPDDTIMPGPGQINNENNLPSNIAQDNIDPDDTTIPGQTNNENNLASNIAQDYIGPYDTTMPGPGQINNENNLPSIIAQDNIDPDDATIPGQTNIENNLASNIAQDYIGPGDTNMPGQTNNENNLASNIAQDYIGIDDTVMPKQTNSINNIVLEYNTQDTNMPEQNKAIVDITDSAPAEDINEQHEQHEIKARSTDRIKLSLKDLDEETKKVKFSNINMENGDKGTQIIKNVSKFTSDYKAPVTWKSSKEYILSHFNVAPPNPNLLSYIDEVWPENTLPPLLKTTESVSKSVSSLGRILEADENIQSPNQKLPMENTEKVFNKQLNTAIVNLTGEGMSENSKKTSAYKDVEKSEIDINKRNKLAEDKQGHDQSLLDQLYKHFATDEDVRSKLHKNEDFQIPKTIFMTEETITDRRTDQDRHSCLDKLSIKKVQKTEFLPSQGTLVWKKPTLQEHGDIITSVNKKIQSSLETNLDTDDFCFENNENVRKWCMGLQNVTENLELWTAWIQNVCLNITYLKYEGMTFNNDALKNKHIRKWIDLKKNIDLDVQQWSKLRTSLRRGLQSYKSSYHSRETTLMQANNRCECKKQSQKKYYINKL